MVDRDMVCIHELQKNAGTHCIKNDGTVDEVKLDTTATTQHKEEESHCIQVREICFHPVPW